VTWKFSQRSLDRLLGVHPALVAIATRALTLSSVDFGISEGLRTPERQAQLVKAGASHTLHSRHLTGHAIDLVAFVGGEVRWDWPLYGPLSKAMKQAAKDLDTPLQWGGDWLSFSDGPHFQLPWGRYPA